MVAANTRAKCLPAGEIPATGCYYPPTLITGMKPCRSLDAERKSLAPCWYHHIPHPRRGRVENWPNNTRLRSGPRTVWSWNINLALDIAPKWSRHRMGETGPT